MIDGQRQLEPPEVQTLQWADLGGHQGARLAAIGPKCGAVDPAHENLGRMGKSPGAVDLTHHSHGFDRGGSQQQVQAEREVEGEGDSARPEHVS